jgi:hypothetical protein
MIFVMSLFAPSAMADNRIAQATRAVAKDCPSANFDPIGFELFCRPKVRQL